MDLYVEAIRVGQGYGPSRMEVALVAEEDETLESLLRRGGEDIQRQASIAYCENVKSEVVPVFTISIVVIGTDLPTWTQIEGLLREREAIQSVAFVGQRQGALDATVTFSGSLSELQQVFGSVNYRLMAYTNQQAQPDAVQVFFFAQPNFQPLPQNVRILPMSGISLSN